MALTQKNIEFLEEYAITGNAAQSYAKIYHVQAKSSNPWKILKSEEAQEDLEECLERLTEIIREGNNAEMLKAIDMRLKTLGAYVSKSEVKVDTPTVIKVSIDESEEGKNED